MLNYFQAIVFAIVQALTEWLPVSSSGHLVIFQQFLSSDSLVWFYVILHLASILALIIFLRKEITYIVRKAIKRDFKLLSFIIVASIPAALVGFFLSRVVEKSFSNIKFVAFSLIFTGLILSQTYFFGKQKKYNYESKIKNKKLNYSKSFLIGCFQALAIFPGVSRSGMTVSAGIFGGLKREIAFKFSLLMAVPVIIGAFLFKIKNILLVNLRGPIIAGFFVCFLASYITISLFGKIVKTGKLHYFAFYCFLVAVLLLIFC